MRTILGLALACLLLAVPAASAQQQLRVTWEFQKVAGSAANWDAFVKSTTADPEGIFDYCSWQVTDPSDLPLSFPGARSPWKSTVTAAHVIPAPNTLTITYDVDLNDVAVLSLEPDLASEWLCGVVSDWRFVVAQCVSNRHSTAASAFQVDIVQTECTTHIGVLTNVRETLPFAAQVDDLWFWSPWFHYFAADYYPWLYHETLGWVYVKGDPEDFYFYSREDQAWYYTKRGVFPEAYHFTIGRWVIFK